GFPFFNITARPAAGSTDNLQAFAGPPDGSPIMPTIPGTPLLNPSAAHPDGLAAKIDMQGELLDFSDLIPGLILAMPDIHFVTPDTTLSGIPDVTTDPVKIPLNFYGGDNHLDPRNLITESYNAVQPDVSLVDTLGGQTTTLDHQTFLLDTGAQLSVISTAEALALGLDLNHPETSITVQGVAGTEDIPGFTLDKLVVPRMDGNG